MPPVRLIATDLDGTLLDGGREMHPASAAALREAHAKGVVVCLASGRALNTMLPYAEKLGVPGPIVSCNGAYVVDQDLREIHDLRLSPASRDALLAYASEHGLHVNAYVKGRVITSGAGPWFEVYRSRVKSELEVASMTALAGHVPTKLLFIDSPVSIQVHRDRLLPTMAAEGVTVVVSEPDYLEFLPCGITKAEGLKAVAAKYGFKREDVAAIGDWDNDLEMVEWAGLGGVVANGSETVKAVADIVVGSNESGGVAEFVRMALQPDGTDGGYTSLSEVRT